MRLRCFLLLMPLVCLLCGCQNKDSAEAMLERYHKRLANALQMPAAEVQLASEVDSRLRYPSRRQLLVPLQRTSLNLLDFLRLSDCDLQRLLGERNSSLGKLMAESQQLIYHRQFLYLGELCLQVLSGNSERAGLRERLAKAVRLKREDSSAVAWNASAASEEFQRLFSLAGGPLTRGESTSFPGELISALHQLETTLRHRDLLQSKSLEAIYQMLGSDNRAGRLLRSQQMVTQNLNALTVAVEARLQRRPLCFQARPTPQAKVAYAVFRRFYIGEVQPYLSAVHRQSRALQQGLQSLLTPWRPWPVTFEGYWQQSWSDESANSAINRFQVAIAEHTRAWQRLLKQCGMSPGAQG